MGDTPLTTDDVWPSLSADQLAAIRAVDEDRLALERSRLPERTARSLSEPVYSVRERFRSWERLVRFLEREPEEHYFVEAYTNELESRDQLDRVMADHPVLARGPAAELLNDLDARFRAVTVEDGGAALRPYVRALGEGQALGERWYRRPRRATWL
ncbi:hypothetical protein [Actinomadura kijaniata]|uniref:hypothetical protein n=1 Tax=Actinomadura kijaniata TaxID=46161 RepID=UPI000829F89F|nr:hypothetical protein [Actinomadura kijaniata]